MKLKLTLLLVVITGYNTFSQGIFECDFDETEFTPNFFDPISGTETEDDDPYIFKIHFYQFNEDDGSNDNVLIEQNFLEGLALLNKNYNQFNIFFKWDGFDYINNSYFYDYDLNNPNAQGHELDTFILDPQNEASVGQSVNVYILNTMKPGVAGSAGQSFLGDIMMIKIRSDWFNHPALAHEMGHILGIKHTFGNFGPQNENDPEACEHVTRDPNDPKFNALTKGDFLISTNATPFRLNYPGVDLDSDCNYIGSALDCDDTPYVEPEFKNIMSYTRSDCYREFKVAQGTVMRWRIKHRFLDDLNHLLDTIHRKELYKPYKGEYYNIGPSTAGKPPLFQPGFDYEFVDVSQAGTYNQPSLYEDTSFWYGAVVIGFYSDYTGQIKHPNHTAIRILQLDEEQPRMCYNNWNRSAINGDVINFLDGIPSSNVTITAQDSLQINDTQLIPNLQPGLYNIITNFNDGTTDQTVIQKNNN